MFVNTCNVGASLQKGDARWGFGREERTRRGWKIIVWTMEMGTRVKIFCHCCRVIQAIFPGYCRVLQSIEESIERTKFIRRNVNRTMIVTRARTKMRITISKNGFSNFLQYVGISRFSFSIVAGNQNTFRYTSARNDGKKNFVFETQVYTVFYL